MTVIISIFEVLLFCLGGSLLIYRSGMRVSEALSSGIVIAFMTLSFIFQTAFLLEQPNLSLLLEGIAISFCCWLLKNRRKYLTHFYHTIKNFFLDHRWICSLLSIALIYLGLQAILLPPANIDSMVYNLLRVLLFQRNQTLYLSQNQITDLRQALFTVGSDILHHIFLRFNTDYGIGLFSFLAYISIGLATYALSRRYTSPKISLTATLIIVSLPEFVYQATSTKNDIMIVAVAMFCFLTIYRILDQLNIYDLLVLLLAFCFGVSAKTTFMAFIMSFSLFFIPLVLRKYSLGALMKLIWDNKWQLILFAFPMFILSQAWLFIHNHFVWGGWAGTQDFVDFHRNKDGLKGGIANLIRVGFQSFHLLKITDILSSRFLGFSPTETLQKIYDHLIYPMVGDAALNTNHSQAGIFKIDWTPHEDFSWFGPLGFFIVLPAIFYSIVKGRKALRASSLTLLGYALILAYKVVWSPWRGRYFSLFFVASGVCVAYLLHSLKFRQKLTLQLLTVCSIIILFLSSVNNLSKPLLFELNQTPITADILPWNWPNSIANRSIWARTNLGHNRLYYAQGYYGDERVSNFRELIPQNSRVALIARGPTWIYHYLLFNPNVTFTIVTLSKVESNPERFDYVLCLQDNCNLGDVESEKVVLWHSEPSSKKPGQLIQLKPSSKSN